MDEGDRSEVCRGRGSVAEISIGGSNQAFSTDAETMWGAGADVTESVDERPVPDIDGDDPGTPPLVDPLLITLVAVVIRLRLEEVPFIKSFDNLLSLNADERNESVSSSVVSDDLVQLSKQRGGMVGGNVGGG